MKTFINTRSGLYIIDLDNVVYLKADGNYTEFYYADGKKRTEMTYLSKCEELIEKAYTEAGEQSPYFRANRSLMVNVNCIRSILFPVCLLTFQSDHVQSLVCTKETLRSIRDHLIKRFGI